MSPADAPYPMKDVCSPLRADWVLREAGSGLVQQSGEAAGA